MGLLDFKLPAMDTPEGQGLLSAAFSLMQAQKMPGQKGMLAGALGDAGKSYMHTTNQSKEQAQRRQMQDMQMQAQRMQLEQAQREQAQRERAEAAIRNQFAPMSPLGALQGGGGPTQANANRIGQIPQFDPRRLLAEGGVGALTQGLSINSALNPKPEGPIKIGENDRLLDPTTYRELVSPVQKPQGPIKLGENDRLVEPGTFRELVSPVQKPQVIDYNKPFLPDGTPNKAYQDYSLTRADRGATRVNVEGSKNIINQENEQSKNYGKWFGDLRGQIQQDGFTAPAKLTKLARMEQLLDGIDSGKLAPLGMDAAGVAKSLGLNVDSKLGNKQAAEALAVEMALAMKPPGSGTLSDKDFDNFMATVPNLAKTAEGRKQITLTLRAKAQRDIEIAKMARAYAKKNKGVLDDEFLDQVAGFVAENPIFSSPAAGNSGGRNTAVDEALKLYPPRK
jgi:hypothetical protein